MNQQITHLIQFRNTTLTCIEFNDEFYVALRPVVEGMGLTWSRQRKKIVADTERFSTVALKATVAEDGKQREMLCIPLQRVFGWLATIHPSRVKPECREAVLAYQRECDQVLFHHFAGELQHANNQLFNGWLKRYPKWVDIFDGLNKGESHHQIMARTGYRSKSTIRRNIHRMGEAGVLTMLNRGLL